VLQATGVDPNTVAAIGVCGFMHTPVGVDATGSIVAPVIVWNDRRGELEAETLREQSAERFRDITGDIPRHNHTAAKLRFLREHFPEAVERVSTWLLPKDYLRFCLTAERGTDVSDALGTLLYDPVRNNWDRSLVELAGGRLETMPSIGESAQVAGSLTSSAAEAMSLRAGIPVAIGSADGYATLLGCNGCEAGRTCLYLGTSAWITRFVADADCDPRKRIVPTPNGYHEWIGAISCAGASLSWLGKLVGAARIDELIAEGEGAGVGARGLFFLPHLAGERGPTYDPDARGSWVGLTLDHGRGELARAVLEGVAFQLRRVVSSGDAGHAIIEACLVGGGAESSAWAQLISDATGMTLEIPEVIEASGLGAAICAAAAIGAVQDVHLAARRFFHTARRYSPDPVRARQYHRVYDTYIRVDDVLAAERTQRPD
jgi:xylulokinase